MLRRYFAPSSKCRNSLFLPASTSDDIALLPAEVEFDELRPSKGTFYNSQVTSSYLYVLVSAILVQIKEFQLQCKEFELQFKKFELQFKEFELQFKKYELYCSAVFFLKICSHISMNFEVKLK